MIVRTALTKDIPQLKNLWHKVFDNDGKYTQLFFKHRYSTCVCLGLFENDLLLSALYLMPCEFKIKEKIFKAQYVFAVATFSNFRNRGYSTFLIKETHKFLKKNGADVAILMPAEKSLFNFYKRLGYETHFYVSKHEYKVNKKSSVPLLKCNLSENYDLREKFCNKTDGFLSWDKSALDFCQIDNNYSNGEILCFPSLCEGYAVCSYFNDIAIIKELICPSEFEKDIINSVGSHFKKNTVILRCQTHKKEIPFGMWYALSSDFKKLNANGSFFLSLPMD